MAEPARRCWDACAILRWLKEEPGWEDCRGVIQQAESGKLVLVVSALAIAEVLMVSGGTKITREDSQTVRSFFEHEYIEVVSLTRPIAYRAQDLVWDHGVDPKDGVHVATALALKVPRLDTFDKKLLSLTEKVGGAPTLVIGKPDIEYQQKLEEQAHDE